MKTHRAIVSTPPAANNLYANRRDGKGRIKTDQYRKWLELAGRSLREAIPPFGKRERVKVTIGASINHQRDLDNIIKPLLDALTAGGVIGDDRYVDCIVAQRWPKGQIPEGFVTLHINSLFDGKLGMEGK